MSQYLDGIDFNQLERDAYQRGDTALAGILAGADDAIRAQDADLAEMTTERDAEAERADKAEMQLENWRKVAEFRIEKVFTVLDQCKRVGGRAEIKAALQDLYDRLLGD